MEECDPDQLRQKWRLENYDESELWGYFYGNGTEYPRVTPLKRWRRAKGLDWRSMALQHNSSSDSDSSSSSSSSLNINSNYPYVYHSSGSNNTRMRSIFTSINLKALTGTMKRMKTANTASAGVAHNANRTNNLGGNRHRIHRSYRRMLLFDNRYEGRWKWCWSRTNYATKWNDCNSVSWTMDYDSRIGVDVSIGVGMDVHHLCSYWCWCSSSMLVLVSMLLFNRNEFFHVLRYFYIHKCLPLSEYILLFCICICIRICMEFH